MEELMIYKYQAKRIELALGFAMRILNTGHKAVETATDRALLEADKFIKEVLDQSMKIDNGCDASEVDLY